MCGRARHRSAALAACLTSSWSARWLGPWPCSGAQSQRLYGASTALLPPPRLAATTTAGHAGPRPAVVPSRSRWADTVNSESPNWPSSGAIITSLGGDTLCPSRHIAWPFPERGVVGASRSDWQLNLRLRLRVCCNLLGVADVQCTRGSPDSETKLKLVGFAPAAKKN